jgi:5'-nucleotidase
LIFPAVTLATGEKRDTSVSVSIGGGPVLGTFPIDTSVGIEKRDEYGKAAVSVILPAGLAAGTVNLTVTGDVTGLLTTVPVTIEVPAPTVSVTLTASGTGQVYGSTNTVTLTATVGSTDGAALAGPVEFRSGDVVLGTAPVVAGVATYRLPATTPAGSLTVTASYPGAAPSAAVTITVAKATSQAILLTTTTSYRQGAFLPAILIGGVVLNNGQQAKGDLQLISGGKVLATVPLTHGLGITLLPRSLPKGTYQIVATFRPADSANVDGVNSNTIQIQVR